MRAGSRHVPAQLGRDGEGNGGPRAAGRLDALERLAGPVVRAAGMDLEEVQLTQVGRRRLLRFVVDAQGGAGLDEMALVSQALSARLDSAGIMGETPYTLEVTSPGVDRPLTKPQHWKHAVGRMVKVGPGAGPAVSGRVIAADDDGVVLDIDGQQRGFGFAELGPGKVQVEFRRDDVGESHGH
jgi:ribosome maturation factor RimP